MKKNSDNDTQTDEAFIDVEKVEWINAVNILLYEFYNT